MTNWTGADLRASREALGISQEELARWLINPTTGQPWKRSRICECERGAKYRAVPDWLPEKMMLLEAMQDDLAEMMIDALESGHVIYVHPDAASYMNAHPGEHHINAALQRTAAAMAVRDYEDEYGIRPHIQYWGQNDKGEDWPEL